MVEKRPIVSVIIVNYNGVLHLYECLASLSVQSFERFEIIFVDNGSSDGSIAYVKTYFPEVKIVSLEQNHGFCGGNNIGLMYCSGDYIALLNNDTRVDKNWLANLYAGIQKDDQIGICASRMINYFTKGILDTAGDGYDICGVGFKMGEGQPVESFNKEHQVFGACAGAALYRRSMINDIGFLDNRFFAYGEDLDLSFRARLAGYECLYVPSAIVFHKVNQTVGADSEFLLYHTRRNVEYTYFKNMPTPLLTLTFPFHLMYVIATFLQATAQGRARIYLKAKIDFLKNIGNIWADRRDIQQKRKASCMTLFSLFSMGYIVRRVFRVKSNKKKQACSNDRF